MTARITDISEFYNKPLGMVTKRMIGKHLRDIWPDVSGSIVLGMGFSLPYLDLFSNEASNIIATISNIEKMARWNNEGFSQTIKTNEIELPFEDLTIDRALLIHAVEHSESIQPMMREIWRVLSNNGRLIIVVPNRRGIWARMESTPFGSGTPYSLSQLTNLLKDTLFTPLTKGAALYMPPSNSQMLISATPIFEKLGQHWFGGLGNVLGGVISIEAIKQIYAPTETLKATSRRQYAIVANQ